MADLLDNEDTQGRIIVDRSTRGTIEAEDDRDWYRVFLRSGTHYQFDAFSAQSLLGSFSDPVMSLYDRNGNILATDDDGGFQNESRISLEAFYTGYYYVEVSAFGAETGTYTASVAQVTPRKTSQIVNPGKRVTLDSIYNPANVDDVQAYSVFDATGGNSGRLARGSRIQSQKVVHSISPVGARKEWTIIGAGPIRQSVDHVYFRYKRRNKWRSWRKVSVFTEPDANKALVSNSALDGNKAIFYSFDSALPGYFSAADYPNVGSLTENQKKAVRNVMKNLAAITGLNIRESGSGPGKHIRIFRSNLSGSETVRSFAPSGDAKNDRGSDLVFNRLNNLVNNPSPGTKGYWKLLQAVAHAFGLNKNPTRLGSFANNHYTAMSNRRSPDHKAVYQDNFGLFDVSALQSIYGTGYLTANNRGNNTYRLARGLRRLTTLVDYRGNDTLDARPQVTPVHLDLREGRSTTADGGRVRYFVAYGTILERALGGRKGDTIVGNGQDNYLHGGAGNDNLRGNEGDDTVIGGSGSDRYLYTFGDGVDKISDIGGGKDLLIIQSPLPKFDKFRDDIAFRRQGTNLEIDLRQDRNTLSHGLIKIINMRSNKSAVETLRLLDANNRKIGPNISLRSVYANATNSFKHFRLVPGSDSYGRLAAPV